MVTRVRVTPFESVESVRVLSFREFPQTVKNAKLFRSSLILAFHLHLLPSPLSFLKNGRREKGQDSSGLHGFVLLFPCRRLWPHRPSIVDFLMGGVSAVCILFFFCLASSSLSVA